MELSQTVFLLYFLFKNGMTDRMLVKAKGNCVNSGRSL